MPQVKPVRKTFPLKYKVIILVAIFVVAAGGGTAAFLYIRSQDRAAVQSALDKRQALVLRGRYDEALALLKAAQPRAHTKNEQLALWYYQGATDLTKNDMQGAYTAFKQYETLGGPTYESSRQIGYAAAMMGHKTEAVAYYRTAIDLDKKANGPRVQDDVAELEARIKVLQP